MIDPKKLIAAFNKIGFVKEAYLGSNGDEASLEELFGRLAHQYLHDKAPSLTPYEQGFQVVEANEEGTKALGITGFKVHGMQIFSPMFYINGEIKGNELLRLVDQNIWVPLKEPWLNEIYRRKPMLLGEGEPKGTNPSSLPDLSDIVEMPMKSAGYTPYWLPPVLRDITHHKPLAKSASVLARVLNPMTHIKRASYGGLQRVNALLNDYPLIKSAFDQLHPGGSRQIAAELERRTIFRKSAARRMLSYTAPVKKYANSVRFMSYSISISGTTIPSNLSDEEKETLLHKGYLVQDDRRDDEVTVLINNDEHMDNLQNPTETGFYDVLVAPNKIRKMLVLRTEDVPHSELFVIDPSAKEGQVLDRNDVWVTKEYPHSEYVKFVKGLSAQSPKGDEHNGIESTKTFLLRAGDEVRGPFSFFDNGSIDYCCCCGCSPISARSGYNIKDRKEKHRMPIGYTRTPEGSAFRWGEKSHVASIPADMRFLRVKDVNDLVEVTDMSAYLMYPAAKMKSVKEASYVGCDPLRVAVGAGECVINGKSLGRLAGLRSLIVDYGLREKDASALLKEAELTPFHAKRVYIKRAELYTPPIPEVDDSPVGMLTSRVPAGPSGTAISTTDSSDISRDPDIDVDSYATQDAMAAQKAIQSGQKEIFDVSMIKSLYTAADTDSLIDEHVTELVKAMTEAGDLLFQFYWKGDQFKDIYGPKSLPELEGNLKKLFEILGDVVLFLKRNRLNQSDYDQQEPLDLEDNNM